MIMLFCVCCVFFFKQKTAYEMRISDWSSDVCSSDLQADQRLAKVVFEQTVEAIVVSDQRDRIVMVNPAFESLTGYAAVEVIGKNPKQIGRASCRERVCQYV